MKIIVEADQFKAALGISRQFMSKTTMSITKGFRLEVFPEKDLLVVESSDFNKGAKVRVKAADNPGTAAKSESEPGSVVVDGEKIHQIARTAPVGSFLLLETKGSALQITASQGSFRFKLASMDEDQFPRLPPVPATMPFVSVDAGGLSAILDKLKFATRKKEGTDRPFEEVIYLRGESAFATDSFKMGFIKPHNLAIKELNITTECTTLLKLLGAGTIQIASAPEMLFAQNNTLFMMIRLPVAPPPSLEVVLTNYADPAIVYHLDSEETQELRDNLKRVCIMNAAVHITPKEDKIFCGSRDAEGESQFIIQKKATKFKEGIGTVCFNALFLNDALRGLEEVELGFFAPKRPVRIKSDKFECLIQALTLVGEARYEEE